MAHATFSDTEPTVRLTTEHELREFVSSSERRCDSPVAVSIEAHGYRADFLVGHSRGLVHLAPDDPEAPYFVSVGAPQAGLVAFHFQANHHTEFEARHLVEKEAALTALLQFVADGTRSDAVEWEQYTA